MTIVGPDRPASARSHAGMNAEDFIARWRQSEAAERANKDSFLKELCRVLGVPEPNVVTGDLEVDDYVFEADASLRDEEGRPSVGKMDLYRRGSFMCSRRFQHESARGARQQRGRVTGNAEYGNIG